MAESIDGSSVKIFSTQKSIAMKKVIVLLIAAIGAGVYFYFSKKQETSTSNFKQLILGKWKVDLFQVPHDDTIFDLEKIGTNAYRKTQRR
jgi:hypothetical protein